MYKRQAIWWEKAAEQGDAESQFNFARMNEKGWGVAENQSKAFFWYRKAAEAGLRSAQSSLGLMYAMGRGVELDYVEAYKWLFLAEKRGDKAAKQNLAHAETLMTPDEVLEAKKRAKFLVKALSAEQK